MVVAAVLVLAGAALFGWLAFGGGAEKLRETAGLIVGHVLPPPPPSPGSPAQPAAIPVPVPPPTPDIPQAPAPLTSGAPPAASRPAPSKTPPAGAPGASPAAATAPEPVTLTNVSSPVRPPESPAPATPAIVRFGKVKLAKEGSAPRETDVILQLEGTRLVLFDPDGRTLVRTLDYQKITGATYSQKERGGFLGLGTRHWLRLDAGADTMLLRLDKGNQARVIEAFERLSGQRVVRDEKG